MRFYFLSVLLAQALALTVSIETGRDGKLLPVFQVVRFPNDPCTVTGATKNGTCYTAEECSSKGGTNGGSCAEGFGVCCTFTYGCGGSTSENCTYFDSASSVNSGTCSLKVCKLNTNICQIRLDFNSFVITGPSTVTLSTASGKFLAGTSNKGGTGFAGDMTRCLTDTFSVTNQNMMPTICGTNSGYHAYFDASDACNSLDFTIGNQVLGVTSAATRAWSIKISQYDCNYENLAPTGCVQYHYGSVSNFVYSFNYAAATLHLAAQKQTICVRRESGYCRICWSASTTTFDVSGTADATATFAKSKCGTYGDDGTKGAYDVVFIPGAIRDSGITINRGGYGWRQCGAGTGGFAIGDSVAAITTAATAQTVCSKELPFRIQFISDNGEPAATEGALATVGFKIAYTMTSC